jgi:phage tail P2-like protein
MDEIRNVSLVDAAPPNIAEDPECAAILNAASAAFRKLADKAEMLILLPNIDRQPSEIVDALAYHYHVDFYDATLPLEIRRELVKNHNEWHRIKGTPAAVERIIQTVFGSGYLVEWFERDGMEPYTFEVHTGNKSATGEKINQFVAAVNAVKNVRSHMVRIVVDENTSGKMYVGAAIVIRDKIKMWTTNAGGVTPDTPDEPINPSETIIFEQAGEENVTVSGTAFEKQDEKTVLWRGAIFTPGEGNTVMIKRSN